MCARKLVRVDGQFRIACTYRTSVHRESPSMALWSNSQSPSTDCADWTPAQFFKQATGPESSGDECGILEDDRCIDTGVSQQPYLLHELVFACSQPPPQQPQISYTFLTQADWCAVRTVARCELGLLLVVNTVGNGGASVLVRAVVPKMRSNNLFLSRQHVFPDHSDRCANAMVKEEELDSRHFLRPQTKGSWSFTRRRAFGFRKWTTTRLLTKCRFSCVLDSRLSQSSKLFTSS